MKQKKVCGFLWFFVKFKITKFNQFLAYYDLSSMLQNNVTLEEKLKICDFS